MGPQVLIAHLSCQPGEQTGQGLLGSPGKASEIEIDELGRITLAHCNRDYPEQYEDWP